MSHISCSPCSDSVTLSAFILQLTTSMGASMIALVEAEGHSTGERRT